MILLALTVAWLGEIVAGLLFFEMFLLLARGVVDIFYGRASAVSFTLAAMTDPLVRPVRRLLRPLGLGFDAAPFVLALLFYGLQLLVLAQSARLAHEMLPGPLWRSPGLALLVRIVRVPLYLYMALVLLRVALTWFRSPSYHPLVRFVSRLVDPALHQVRRLAPRLGHADVSPLLLLAALWFVDRVLLEALTLHGP